MTKEKAIHFKGCECYQKRRWVEPSNSPFVESKTTCIETKDRDKVTCKVCLKGMDDRPLKVYNVTWFYDSEFYDKYVEAKTASSAKYKAFKQYFWNDEELASDEFKFFVKYSNPKVKLENNMTPSLTWEEEQEAKEKELKQEADLWNKKYPVGSKVLFQRDGRSECVIREIQAPAFVDSKSYLSIFLVGVSGSYLLSPRFVRPYVGNEDLLGTDLRGGSNA